MRRLTPGLILLGCVPAVLAQTSPPPGGTPPPPPTAQQTQPPPPPPPAPAPYQRVFWGGGLGLSFGTVQYIEVAPLVGCRVTPAFGLGVSPFYRYRKDSRYEPELSTSDYGVDLFARYNIVRGLFAQAEYDYTNYEYYSGLGGTTRDNYSAFLAGGGFSQPVGRATFMFVVALYDFSYDSNDPHRPYNSPWVFRAGVSVGF